MGNFNQATAVAAEWSGVARRGERESERARERERGCVRVDGGRIELWKKDGWMEVWREGEREGGESGLPG